MERLPSAHQPLPDNAGGIGDAELLPRQPVVRTADLDYANAHLTRVLAEHRLSFVRREHRLDFRHQLAKLGPVALNALQFGADIEVDALQLPDSYLLQFMLAGSCRIIQAGHSYDMPAGSVAVINPCRPFLKFWSPAGRQLMLRIERSLLEREFRAWTGRDDARPIEFQQSQAIPMENAGTLTSCVRMLCNDLCSASPGVAHPFIRDRMLSALASTLLVSMPHNQSCALEAANTSVAPFSVRRAEQFVEENAQRTIGLHDLAGAAGVSARALEMAFRRFRSTTPMAYLRAVRLELARNDLANASRQGLSVAAVANACGFSHLGRFAHDYKARFGELPSETLYRGSVGRAS